MSGLGKAVLQIMLECDDMEIDEIDNFDMTDLITEINNITTEDLDIFINIDNDDSKEFVQVNLRVIEKELLLKENRPSAESSVEENLENEDEAQ
jgi:hypothetical protein